MLTVAALLIGSGTILFALSCAPLPVCIGLAIAGSILIVACMIRMLIIYKQNNLPPPTHTHHHHHYQTHTDVSRSPSPLFPNENDDSSCVDLLQHIPYHEDTETSHQNQDIEDASYLENSTPIQEDIGSSCLRFLETISARLEETASRLEQCASLIEKKNETQSSSQTLNMGVYESRNTHRESTSIGISDSFNNTVTYSDSDENPRSQNDSRYLIHLENTHQIQESSPLSMLSVFNNLTHHIQTTTTLIETTASHIAQSWSNDQEKTSYLEDDPGLSKTIITCKKKLLSAYKKGKKLYQKYNVDADPQKSNHSTDPTEKSTQYSSYPFPFC